MILNAELQTRLDRACDWIAQMTEDGGARRWFNLKTSEPGPVSSEITGYAAHLWAWLWANCHVDIHKRNANKTADWLLATWEGGTMPVEPGKKEVYFFDTGMAVRGLYAVSKALGRMDCWDGALSLCAWMTNFETGRGMYSPILRPDEEDGRLRFPDPEPEAWWSTRPGAYQRKAALAFKLCARPADYDDLDLLYRRVAPPEVGDLPAKKLNKADDANLLASLKISADYMHPWAYSCEALLMSDASADRAAVGIRALGARINHGDVCRADAFAQYLRLCVKACMPVSQAQIVQLIEMQHKEGGFHFRRIRGVLSEDLSVHATIFAAQAIAMLIDKRRAGPAALGRRELAIV